MVRMNPSVKLESLARECASPSLAAEEDARAARPSRLFRRQLCILNETDLHKAVVAYIRRFHCGAIVVAGLGELQDTAEKRLASWAKGYLCGQPDLLILNRHRRWAGLAIEFKNPGFEPEVPRAQREALEALEAEGWSTLVSNDYDAICRRLDEYAKGFYRGASRSSSSNDDRSRLA